MTEKCDAKSLQAWARFAGGLYLFTNAAAIFAFYVAGEVIEKNDSMRTAANLAESATFFRMGMASEIVMIGGLGALLVALYVVLKPINRNLALLAAVCRLIEIGILTSGVFGTFMAIELVSSAAYWRGADSQMLNGLMYASMRVHSAGFRFSFLFLGLASALFSYLWMKSGFVPWWVAAWGLFASSVMAIFTLAFLVYPQLSNVVGMTYMAPMGIYEFGLGLWLLTKGIKIPSEQ